MPRDRVRGGKVKGTVGKRGNMRRTRLNRKESDKLRTMWRKTNRKGNVLRDGLGKVKMGTLWGYVGEKRTENKVHLLGKAFGKKERSNLGISVRQ